MKINGGILLDCGGLSDRCPLVNAHNILIGARKGGAPVAPAGTPSQWYDANAITGLNDGEELAQWLDSSGNGKTLGIGAATTIPTYQTNEQNGLPVVRFDGTNDYISGSMQGSSITAITGFMVFKGNAAAAEQRMLISYKTGEVYFVIGTGVLAANDVGIWVYDGTGVDLTNEGPCTTWQYISWTAVDSGVLSGWRNGVSMGTPQAVGSFASLAGDVTGVGAKRGNTSNWYSGDIGEIILYTSELSATDRENTEAYLAAKWGI